MTVMADTIPLAEAHSLVARARAGDSGALEHLYRAYEGSVYTLARRLTRTPEDAEDVLQETFLEICRSLSRWRGEGSLWGWVRQIAASKALMRYRREKLRATEVLDDDPAERAGDDVPLRLDLEAALRRLPERTRTVVWLHDVEGMTHEEIAELMGMTTSFSKSQLARAHQKLRGWLGEEGADR
jgi:RNA polymerase sigma-70 factor (ECF subfamily)